MNNLTFGQYTNELVNLYKVRAGFNGDQARRMLIDMIDDVLEEFQAGTSPQEYFQNDVDSWN